MTAQQRYFNPWSDTIANAREGGKAEGRAEGLHEAWLILLQVSQNGGSLSEAIQSVHWRYSEAKWKEG